MVVIGVEDRDEPIGISAVHVASTQPGPDRLTIVKARPDIDRIVVIQDAYFGALADRLALFRIDLREIADHGGGRPGGVIESAIDPERLIGSRSLRPWCSRMRELRTYRQTGGRVLRVGCSGECKQRKQECPALRRRHRSSDY